MTAMQIRLTVLGARGGPAARACDVLVTAPAGTALAAVASGLAAAVAASSAGTAGSPGLRGTGAPGNGPPGARSEGAPGNGPSAADWAGRSEPTAPPRATGASGVTGSGARDFGGDQAAPSAGPVVLYAGRDRLDPKRCALGEPPLTDGAILSLNAPAEPGRHPGVPLEAPRDASARLHVVAGPDAGGVHLLHGGEIRVGRSADADVLLDDPDVSRLHCAVTVADDGRVTIADLNSTNGTSVDGARLDPGPIPFRPGALVRLGESTLWLADARPRPGAAVSPSGEERFCGGVPLVDVVPTVPDGEGHLRVPTSVEAPPAPLGADNWSAPAGRGERSAPAGCEDPSAPGVTDARPPAGGAEAWSTPAVRGEGHARSASDAGPAHPDRTPPGHETASGGGAAARYGSVTQGAVPASSGHGEGTGGAPAAGPRGATGPGGEAGHGAGREAGHGAGREAAHGAGREARPGAGGASGAGVSGETTHAWGAGAMGTAGAAPHLTGGPGPADGRPAGVGRTADPHPAGDPPPGPHDGRTTHATGALDASGTAATPQAFGGPASGSPDRWPGPRDTTHGWGTGAVNSAAGAPRAGGSYGPPDPYGSPDPYLPGPPADPYAPGPPPQEPPHTPHGGPSGETRAASGDLGHGGGAPAGSPDARAATPRRSTRRARGIGAWARRLTGARGDAYDADSASYATGTGTRTGTNAGSRPGYSGDVPDDSGAVSARWPDPAEVLLTALGPGPRLWERGPGHPDALVVRVGTAERPGTPATPVTVDLRETGSLGLAGPRARLAGLARSVVAQLAALHSPADLEIVLISTDRSRPAADRLAEWSWLGWLPQLRPAHGQDCRLLLAYDREQAAARTAELVRRLNDGPMGPSWVTADRAAVAAAARVYDGPDTLVIVDGDPGSAALRGTTARLAAGGPVAGVHLLCLADAPAASAASPLTATFEEACAASPPFPECGAAALLSGDVATALRVMPLGPGGPLNNGVVATVDAVAAAWAERFARALAPLRPAGADGESVGGVRRVAAPLPRQARLLDALGLARATPASLTARWTAAAEEPQALDGGRARAVPGVGPHGPLAVDLATDGPHVLVEGGPGTGKTELLRSLAASLAAGDAPDRVSLLLVDGAARGDGLRVCTELPHALGYLSAGDPVPMREFAQALSAELKRRAELLGDMDFAGWHRARGVAARLVAPRGASSGDVESARSEALRLGAAGGSVPLAPTAGAAGATNDDGYVLPRLIVLVDDLDALAAPGLGSPGRPAAGSVMRALDAVARDGERLGVHLVAATGSPDRTADTAVARQAGLRVTLEVLPARAEGQDAGEAAPGRGRLLWRGGTVTPFQAGRITGRIPRTATQRPTVVPLEWERMGDPPTRRPLRELGNGPTDLALLASALQRAATTQSGAATVPRPREG